MLGSEALSMVRREGFAFLGDAWGMLRSKCPPPHFFWGFYGVCLFYTNWTKCYPLLEARKMASRDVVPRASMCMQIGYVGWGQLFWCAQTLFVSLYLNVLWTYKRGRWAEVLSSSLPSCPLPVSFLFSFPLLLCCLFLLLLPWFSLLVLLTTSFPPLSIPPPPFSPLSPTPPSSASSPWRFSLSLPPTSPLPVPPSSFSSLSFSYYLSSPSSCPSSSSSSSTLLVSGFTLWYLYTGEQFCVAWLQLDWKLLELVDFSLSNTPLLEDCLAIWSLKFS